MLAREVGRLGAALSSLDATGTRGTVAAVGVVQVQITELTRDVGGVSARLDQHESEHRETARAAERERVSRSRYRVSTFIAGVSALGGVYGLLFYVAAHLH